MEDVIKFTSPMGQVCTLAILAILFCLPLVVICTLKMSCMSQTLIKVLLPFIVFHLITMSSLNFTLMFSLLRIEQRRKSFIKEDVKVAFVP
jgi:hypothetical protein